MERYIIVYSKYVITLFMILFTALGYYSLRFSSVQDQKRTATIQAVFLFLLQFTAYLTICLEVGRIEYLFFYCFLQIAMFSIIVLYAMVYPDCNRILINQMCMLLTVGLILLTRLELSKAIKQLAIAAVGMAVAMAIPALLRKYLFWKKIPWVYAGIGAAALTIVLILGQVTHGSKISYTIGGITFQPSEFVKILYVFFVAAMLAKSTSFKQVVLTGAVAAVHVLILVASRDLGSALIFFAGYIFMVYLVTKKIGYLLGGLAAGAAASVVAWKLFSHVQVRVQAWQDPWSVIDKEGYQITQSLFAIGRGGWFGLGIGQGTPSDIPYVETDFIFSAVAEEMGVLFAVCVLAICLNCFWYFLKTSAGLRGLFWKNLAGGIAVIYIFQVFLTVGGGTKFIPLTGVTLPLVSYGGSSVLATVVLFAVVQGLIMIKQDEDEWIEEKRRKAEQRKRQRYMERYLEEE